MPGCRSVPELTLVALNLQVFIALGVAIDETTPVSAHDLVGWGVMGKLEVGADLFLAVFQVQL
jgi:hypothetical protein